MLNFLKSISDWLTGVTARDPSGYMMLSRCMHSDWLWIGITVALDLAVASGYILIARHWAKNAKLLPPTPAKRALRQMKNIFLFCGICGYIFIPIKMFWPAWRLYDVAMAFLVYFTWRYAWDAINLKVVYSELGNSNRLLADLEKSREESRRKSHFLNAISHDLRTPLNGLMLQAALAEISAVDGDHEAVRKSVSEITSSAKATSRLLDSLLEYARVDWSNEQNHLETFDLALLLEDVTRPLRAMAEEKGIALRVVSANVRVLTDRMKLERVIQNLVANALKFTESGEVRLEVENARQGVELHVIDTGVGISVENQARLFEEFFQVHNNERDRNKGFGLGLAISRRLARQLGGDITVESAAGRGSRFTVVLPQSCPKPQDQSVSNTVAVTAAG